MAKRAKRKIGIGQDARAGPQRGRGARHAQAAEEEEERMTETNDRNIRQRQSDVIYTD